MSGSKNFIATTLYGRGEFNALAYLLVFACFVNENESKRNSFCNAISGTKFSFAHIYTFFKFKLAPTIVLKYPDLNSYKTTLREKLKKITLQSQQIIVDTISFYC